MKVSELIEKLQLLDPEHLVFVQDPELTILTPVSSVSSVRYSVIDSGYFYYELGKHVKIEPRNSRVGIKLI